MAVSKQFFSENLKSLGLEILFRTIGSSNYREVGIPKNDYYQFFPYQTCALGVLKKRLKETFLLRTQNMCYYRQLVKKIMDCIDSKSSVSQIYFKLASIFNNRSLNFQGFTVVFVLQKNWYFIRSLKLYLILLLSLKLRWVTLTSSGPFSFMIYMRFSFTLLY